MLNTMQLEQRVLPSLFQVIGLPLPGLACWSCSRIHRILRRTCSVFLKREWRLILERVSMERPGRFMNAGMLGIVIESSQDDTVTESQVNHVDEEIGKNGELVFRPS